MKRYQDAIDIYGKRWSNKILDNLEDDYNAGKIDYDVYNSIKNGIRNTGVGFIQNAIIQKTQDVGSAKIADEIYAWIKQNTEVFMNRGLIGAMNGGGEQLITKTPTLLTQAVRTGSKYAVPVIGTVIDFGFQVAQGENVVDAGVNDVRM